MPIQKGPLGNDIGSTEIAAGAVTYTKLASDVQQNLGIGFKNRIINGDMRIDQRNAGASITPSVLYNTYTVDRWKTSYSVASKFSVQQNANSVTPPAGFKNYLGATSTSAYTVGAGETFAIQQTIEGYNIADLGWGSVNAKTITFSFWVRSSLTGLFGGTLRNGDGDRSYVFSYTISSANTWEQKIITIVGSTSGTWYTDNNSGVTIDFGLGAGSSASTTAGAWIAGNYRNVTGATSVVGTSGATFYLTGVQLEVGSSATPFETRAYGTELALCQRYFEKSFKPSTPCADNSGEYSFRYTHVQSGYGTFVPVRFSVTKRADPTVIIYNPAATGAGKPIDSATSNTFTNVFIQSPHPSGFAGHWYSGSADGTGNPVAFNFTASAEL